MMSFEPGKKQMDGNSTTFSKVTGKEKAHRIAGPMKTPHTGTIG